MGHGSRASRASRCVLAGGALLRSRWSLSAQAPVQARSSRSSRRSRDSYVSGPTLLRATSSRPQRGERHVLRRRPSGLRADAPAVRMRVGRRPRRRGAPGAVVATLVAGGRVVRTVRTKALSLRRKGRRRRRAGDRDRHATAAAVSCRDLPRSAFQCLEDGKPQAITHFTSEDVPLELIVAVDISGSMTPAMPKLKRAVKEFLGARAAQRSGHAARLQRQHFHADAQDRPIPRSACKRRGSAGALGRHGALRRDPARRRHARPPDRTQSAHRVHGWRGSGQPRRRSQDVERRLQSSDVTLYMIATGPRRDARVLKKGDGAARERRPAAARCSPTASTSSTSAFADLLDELSNQYLLGYQPTQHAARRRLAQDQSGSGRPPRSARPARLPGDDGKMTHETSNRRARRDRRAKKMIFLCVLVRSLRFAFRDT